jgi:hypothetical protein
MGISFADEDEGHTFYEKVTKRDSLKSRKAHAGTNAYNFWKGLLTLVE